MSVPRVGADRTDADRGEHEYRTQRQCRARAHRAVPRKRARLGPNPPATSRESAPRFV